MKKLLWRLLMLLRAYPHIHFTYSPFKVLEFAALVEGIDWRGDERVLDIGCGNGLHSLLLGRRCGQVTGLDVNPEFIAEARWFAARLPDIRADFRAEPLESAGFPASSFDRIFSICVLEHIPDHERVLRECLRCLKPGGEIRFSVDTLERIEDPALVARHAAEHHVQKYYRAGELRDLLAGLGFTDVTTRPLFRSDLARRLFVEGIERGFNFGRVRTYRLTRRLAAAEAAAPDGPGLFLAATARKSPAADTGRLTGPEVESRAWPAT